MKQTKKLTFVKVCLLKYLHNFYRMFQYSVIKWPLYKNSLEVATALEGGRKAINLKNTVCVIYLLPLIILDKIKQLLSLHACIAFLLQNRIYK